MAEWQEPKVDWVTNPKNPRAEDFNRIEGNIQFLKEDIENKKQLIVDAVNEAGQVETSMDDAFGEIANKIKSVPNNGAVIVTPSREEQTIPRGYHNGQGKVKPIPTNYYPINGVVEERTVDTGQSISVGDFVSFAGETKYRSPSTFNMGLSNPLEGQVISIDNNHAFVLNRTSGDYLYLNLLTFNGKSINKLSSNYTITSSVGSRFKIIKVTNDTFAVIYKRSQAIRCQLVKYSNGQIIFSNTVSTSPNEKDVRELDAILLNNNTLIIGEAASGTGTQYYIHIISISGMEITRTNSVLIYSPSLRSYDIKLTKLTDSQFLMMTQNYNYSNSTSDVVLHVCTVDGTSVTKGSPYTLYSGNSPNGIGCISFSSTKALVHYVASGTRDVIGRILTISGTSISAGSSSTISLHSLSYGDLHMAKLNDTTIIINYSGAVMLISYSGSSVIQGNKYTIPQFYTSLGYLPDAGNLNYFFAYDDKAIMIDYCSRENYSIATFYSEILKATSFDKINGVALGSGTAGNKVKVMTL